MSEADPHPCMRCGACCAMFRVSMHWSEAAAELGGTVPPELTERVDAHQICMRGTWSKTPRCIALDAEIGVYSRCRIHPQRPSTCHGVKPGDGQCNRARAGYGLAPISAP